MEPFYKKIDLAMKAEFFAEELKALFELALDKGEELEGLQAHVARLPSDTVAELRALVESIAFRELRKLTLLQFLQMRRSKDYGPMGEERVMVSFCRCIAGVPNDSYATTFASDILMKALSELEQSYDESCELVPLIKNYELDMVTTKLSLLLYKRLNACLKALGSDKEVILNYYKGSPSVFFTEVEYRNVGDFNYYITKREYVRSPENVLSIAATQGSYYVRIRREVCEVIFYTRWQTFFEQSKHDRWMALRHPNSAIADGLKEQALARYKVFSSAEAQRIKPLFIDEMIDGILWHEIGHTIGESEKHIPRELKVVDEGLGRGQHYFRALGEALADWAPREGEKQGAMSRFCEINRQDPEKAQRLAAVYLSDNWFVGETEEYMAAQNDILSSLLLSYCEPGSGVRFEELEADIPRVHAFLASQYKDAARRVLDVLASHRYKVGEHDLDFERLKEETFKLYKGSTLDMPMEKLLLESHFWTNIFAYARRFGVGFSEDLEASFKSGAEELYRDLLRFLHRDDPVQPGESLRQYIYDRYRAMDILKEQAVVDVGAAIAKASSALALTNKDARKVRKRFDQILSGEELDCTINYDAVADPFVAVLQEMLVSTGLGSIMAPVIIGESFTHASNINERLAPIVNGLEDIMDKIASDYIRKVARLKVNDDPKVRPYVEQGIRILDFNYGEEAVHSAMPTIEFGPIESGDACEAYIPLERGIMDWNTLHAIKRVNDDLRPEDFILQWTVDKYFLETLVGAYLS